MFIAAEISGKLVGPNPAQGGKIAGDPCGGKNGRIQNGVLIAETAPPSRPAEGPSGPPSGPPAGGGTSCGGRSIAFAAADKKYGACSISQTGEWTYEIKVGKARVNCEVVEPTKKDKNFCNLKGFNLACDVTDASGAPDTSHGKVQWSLYTRGAAGWDRATGRIGGGDYKDVLFCDK